MLDDLGAWQLISQQRKGNRNFFTAQTRKGKGFSIGVHWFPYQDRNPTSVKVEPLIRVQAYFADMPRDPSRYPLETFVLIEPVYVVINLDSTILDDNIDKAIMLHNIR